MGHMGYLGNCRDLGQTAVEMQTRLLAQLEACCDPAGRAGRHQPSDSDLPFRPRPNYAVLSSVLAALLFAASGAAQARTINAASPSHVDVTNAIASAVDGDTVIVPAGTASWTSGITLTKGITLIGQTTTNPVAKTANDQTIILDDVVRPPSNSNPIIALNPGAGKVCRVSGFSFRPGSVTATNFNGAIAIKGPQSTAVRFDHCHFVTLHQISLFNISTAVYGVIDHNVLDFPSGNQSFVIRMANWGGSGNYGDGSWSDPSFWGSEKFIFIEDNCLNNTSSSELSGSTDGDYGGRWVFRYNHCYDIEMGGHGTEGRFRGIRAVEIYNNDFHFSFARNLGGLRGGTSLIHDNTYDGLIPVHTMALQTYRTFFLFPGIPFLAASGDNPWDLNDTEGNGTNVPGHAPFRYDSGTVTSGSTTTLVDNSKNWTPHQWIGFTARRLSDNGIAYIIDNTSNTLTVYYRAVQGGGVTWAAGNQYQIHRLLAALDQTCRGQSDPITGDTPINTVTGTAAWPHQALEPCYSWNNTYTPTGASLSNYLYQGDGPKNYLLEGRDFYNDTHKPGYTPYTYPHPLVGGASPTPAQTPSAPQNLRVIGP
jgi:hypothetical protein